MSMILHAQSCILRRRSPLVGLPSVDAFERGEVPRVERVERNGESGGGGADQAIHDAGSMAQSELGKPLEGALRVAAFEMSDRKRLQPVTDARLFGGISGSEEQFHQN